MVYVMVTYIHYFKISTNNAMQITEIFMNIISELNI